MFGVARIITADPSCLGRVDLTMFPPQTLMEMLISEIDNKEKIRLETEDPIDYSFWNGVTVENGELRQIQWTSFNLRGSLNLQIMVPTIQVFSVSTNHLEGTVNLHHLSRDLQRFYLFENNFSGEVSLTCLPEKLRVFYIGNNRFHGTLDLTQLPKGMEHLSVHHNHFEGVTDFSQLPPKLSILDISHTDLEGQIVENAVRRVVLVDSKVKIIPIE
mmetsp:Transcript_38702/g.61326  ORF Transcript_38702/g.61326 Transcript_38702/m.61326 type:complete len:216 (-) Transcript_38702:24-671(-)